MLLYPAQKTVQQLCCSNTLLFVFRKIVTYILLEFLEIYLYICEKNSDELRQVSVTVLPWKNKMLVEILKQHRQGSFLCAGDEGICSLQKERTMEFPPFLMLTSDLATLKWMLNFKDRKAYLSSNVTSDKQQ